MHEKIKSKLKGGRTETLLIPLKSESIGNEKGKWNYIIPLKLVPPILPSSIQDLSYLFKNIDQTFITNLVTWDVSSVTDMSYMFQNAFAFNQNISSWIFSSVLSMSFMFKNVTLSTDIYDSLLISMSQQTLQNGVVFGGGNSQYSSNAADAIEILENQFGWTINDNGENPLPVELANFNGSSTLEGVKLNWVTQTETDNAGFVLLRNDIEIANYNTSDSLKGHGTTSQNQTYHYIDKNVVIGETYTYELLSIDYSGERHTYNKIVEVMYSELHDNQKVEEYALNQNYPNPFNPSTTITYTMKKAGVATLKVYDVLGRLVIEQTKASVKGENQINFNGSKLTSGMYYYQLSADGFSKTLKMMLVK